MKEFIKWIFKYRNYSYKWFTITLFARQRYDIAVGLDIGDMHDYPMLFISFIFINFDFTFAPLSWFEKRTLKDYDNSSLRVFELDERAYNNIMKDTFKE